MGDADNGMLSSLKKEDHSDTYHDTDNFKDVKLREINPVTKILHDCTYGRYLG